MYLIFCYTPRAIQNLNCLPIFTGCSVTLCSVAYGFVVLRRSFWTQKLPTECNDGDQPWMYPQVKRGILSIPLPVSILSCSWKGSGCGSLHNVTCQCPTTSTLPVAAARLGHVSAYLCRDQKHRGEQIAVCSLLTMVIQALRLVIKYRTTHRLGVLHFNDGYRDRF